jgi:hypothetical protein
LIHHAADVAQKTRTEPKDGATVEARRARASDLSRAGRLAI